MFLPLLLLSLISSFASSLPTPISEPLLRCDDKHENGEKFNAGNFVKECRSDPFSWKLVIVGCLSPAREEIAIGENVKEDGVQYTCVKTKDGARIEDQKIIPESEGEKTHEDLLCNGKYTNGQRFNSGNFIKQCVSTPFSWSLNIVGCLTPEKKEIDVGSVLVEGQLQFNCIKTETGVRLQSDFIRRKRAIEYDEEGLMKCEGGHRNGTKFRVGTFVKYCESAPHTWTITNVACLTATNEEIPLNKSVIEDGIKYNCIETDTGATLETAPFEEEESSKEEDELTENSTLEDAVEGGGLTTLTADQGQKSPKDGTTTVSTTTTTATVAEKEDNDENISDEKASTKGKDSNTTTSSTTTADPKKKKEDDKVVPKTEDKGTPQKTGKEVAKKD